jgi:putative selenium metabolism protein SsnA
MNTLLRNATILRLDPPSVARMDLRISEGKIVERGSTLRSKPNEERVDLRGKLVMPGLVCAHTHLYSSLARGMPPPGRAPTNFLEILQRIWWKLDQALDEDAIYYSALVGAIEAVKSGTTVIIDHHASPRSIRGSLDVIKSALAKVGVRGVLCYEVTDRGGTKLRDQGLEENDRFLHANRTNLMFRGLVGAHASFTLSDASLRACHWLAETHDAGVHLHVAEDLCDLRDARQRSYKGLVARLEGHGILRPDSLLAHCVHLRPAEFQHVHTRGAWAVHNPRSNMNNNVGHAPLHLFGEKAALGTDGFTADMFEEGRFGFFRNRESRVPLPPDSFLHLHAGGHKLASEIFGQECGTLREDAMADLVILDYDPPTPMTGENLASHLLFGIRSSMVVSVMVNGKWSMWDRQMVNINEERLSHRVRRVAKNLWARMHGK